MTWLSEKQLKAIRAETIDQCKVCSPQKRGIVVTQGRLVDCECIEEFRSLRKLTEANIPRRYWEFDLKYLTKKFTEGNQQSIGVIKLYKDNIDTNIAQGNWLYIQGESGLAKSAMASMLLRLAIQRGHRGYMVRLSQLTEIPFLSYDHAEYRELLEFLRNDAELIVVEEMDKDYGVKDSSSAAGSKIAEFFGNWYDRKASVIMTSNIPKTSLVTIHSPSVVDRVNEAIDIILVGDSFRSHTETEKRLIGQISK